VEERHKETDRQKSKERIGTTGTGQGPANADRAYRIIETAKDKKDLEELLTDVPAEIHRALDKGKLVIGEGSQGTMLSIYHGFYPFVTSQDVSASGLCVGMGIGPRDVDRVFLVFKAYTSKVGEGPFPTEMDYEEVPEEWKVGEYGTVTGRPRRIGEFDYELGKKSIKINSATDLVITCLDKRFPETRGVTKYRKLSRRAKKFVKNVEKRLGVKATLISTGPDIMEMIDRR